MPRSEAVWMEPGQIDTPTPFLNALGLAGLTAHSHPLSWKVPSTDLNLPSEGRGHISQHAWMTTREESVLSRAHPERSGAADSSAMAADQAENCTSLLFPASQVQLCEAITDNMNDALELTCSLISASAVTPPCAPSWPQQLPRAPLAIKEREGEEPRSSRGSSTHTSS